MMSSGQCKPDPPSFPHVNSHEIAGEIAALHPFHSQGFKVGERVISTGRPYGPCGDCFECKGMALGEDDDEGYSVVCPKCKLNGMSKWGGFAEYVVVDARQIARIPEALRTEDAAPLSCAGLTVFGALKKAKLKSGDRVAIVGCGGGLGHLGLQFADAMGYRTLGIDAADGPLELARGLGTKAEIVDAREVNAEELVQRMGKEDGKTERGEIGVDAAVILVESQKGFDLGFDIIRNHGTCVVVSYAEAGFRISSSDLVYRDVRVVGTILGSNKMLREMMGVATKFGVRPVTTIYPFERLNELVDEYHMGKGGKFVLRVKEQMATS